MTDDEFSQLSKKLDGGSSSKIISVSDINFDETNTKIP